MIASQNVLELRDVRRHFVSSHGRVDVLRGVDLKVKPGEYIIVTGPSGSGKTTLLNIASLMEQPTGGNVVFDGQDVTSLDEELLCFIRKERVGVVFQRFYLLPHRSAIENVMFRFRYVGEEEDTARKRAEEALEIVGLAHAKDRPARVLSVGEMQRVAIARAVALRPRLLVADEPTGNLDHASADSVMACFDRLNKDGITILMVTHNEGLLSHARRHLECRDGVLKDVE